MTEFKTYMAFKNFRWHVLRRSRYVLDSEAEQFLQAVRERCEKRAVEIPERSLFWRAQRGHGTDVTNHDGDEIEYPCPHPTERMRPLEGFASEGRVNPKGIPCLYVASDRETAMSEVRPSVGTYVSVGQFMTKRKLRVVDCSVGHDSGVNLFFHEPTEEEKDKAIWNDIDKGFSEPLTVSDTSADYAPTQILSELFKSLGCDGVVYKSKLGSGYNIAIFDLDDARIINCFLFRAEAVKFEFGEVANPYFVKDPETDS